MLHSTDSAVTEGICAGLWNQAEQDLGIGEQIALSSKSSCFFLAWTYQFGFLCACLSPCCLRKSFVGYCSFVSSPPSVRPYSIVVIDRTESDQADDGRPLEYLLVAGVDSPMRWLDVGLVLVLVLGVAVALGRH